SSGTASPERPWGSWPTDRCGGGGRRSPAQCRGVPFMLRQVSPDLPPVFSRPMSSARTHRLRPVVLWLITGCVLIACMVAIGGITRLTGSGLSITEWKPIIGALPPMNDAEWEEAFDKYKQVPEYTLINQHMEMADFKAIFFWEFL